ncbi:Holliday junction resolvase [Legionella norrlandica]|uniref:Putative pre-16S rRNA nuclease n=1 Tax=Legionella norrlandica TaxID=1498499 RepID=A0A0A2SU29_9GAMM|nr:Holliday junction resolvase RuvX [Legionella norrlandica]KGP63236.1 Holliday junction resolvase [Legionella norrlandica]
MPNAVYLGFDFGYKRIGVAVGQRLTCSASPLSTINAKAGVPDWNAIQRVISQWNPQALIVGLPTCIDGKELYTTSAARHFAKQLHKQFTLPVYLVDERLSTVEARGHLFEQGGYRKIKKTEVDSIAACVILEQWLQQPEEFK